MIKKKLVNNLYRKLAKIFIKPVEEDSNGTIENSITGRGSSVMSGNIPKNYGTFWKSHQGDLEWYTWMYKTRIEQHQCFHNWFKLINQLQTVGSVLELGCGYGVGHAEFFKDLRFVGADLSDKAITWCKANRVNPSHDYLVCDFIQENFREKFDLVFSQGTIDNTYDMDRFLKAAVGASKQWIYVTAYRGFFPELAKHRYSWNEEHGCFYNDLSPLNAFETLLECGCHNIAVLPAFTGRTDIPFETLVIARAASE